MSNSEKHTFEVGAVLSAKWVILGFIGKGGMGEVYRAHQLNLDRDVAIKVISREWVGSFAGETEAVSRCIERFRREVRVMARIRHPNVIQVFDYGTILPDGEAEGAGETLEFMVMEYIPGATLRSTMSDEGFYPEEDRVREWVKGCFLPVLDGVAAFHEAGVVHRDIKPENILLDGNVPKIADFGLARACYFTPVTQSVDIQGTPPYMSPEHFLDLKRVDERTDIYALGKILFEAADGRMKSDTIPFKSARLTEAGTPFFEKLDGIIQKATAEEKGQRFASVHEFRDAIHKWLDEARESIKPAEEPLRRRSWRKKVLAAAVAMLFLLGIGAFLLSNYLPFGHKPQIAGPEIPQQVQTGQSVSKSAPLKPGAPLPAKLVGEDFDTMHLVPGGKLTLPDAFGAGGAVTVDVKPFYMNETTITNQQYVNFLNKALPRIRVENGVVLGDDKIWLMLGQVTEGYEPIIFRNGKFHVSNAMHSACPVLRVSAYGAQAYTAFYDLRLPTQEEWLYATIKGQQANVNGTEKGLTPTPEAGGGMHGHMQSSPSPGPASPNGEANQPPATPVMLFKPNAFGIRQLDKNIGEWGVRKSRHAVAGSEAITRYVVLGRPAYQGGTLASVPSGVQRSPWESFEEVGFRCVRDAPEGAAS